MFRYFANTIFTEARVDSIDKFGKCQFQREDLSLFEEANARTKLDENYEQSKTTEKNPVLEESV